MRTRCTALAVGVIAAAGSVPGLGAAYAGTMANNGRRCAAGGTSLSLAAKEYRFDKDCLAVPAGQRFSIQFENEDNDGHNVVILPSRSSTETYYRGEIVQGPATATYSVPALKEPGTFYFHCEVHPDRMNGTFVVAAGRAPEQPPRG